MLVASVGGQVPLSRLSLRLPRNSNICQADEMNEFWISGGHTIITVVLATCGNLLRVVAKQPHSLFPLKGKERRRKIRGTGEREGREREEKGERKW